MSCTCSTTKKCSLHPHILCPCWGPLELPLLPSHPQSHSLQFLLPGLLTTLFPNSTYDVNSTHILQKPCCRTRFATPGQSCCRHASIGGSITSCVLPHWAYVFFGVSISLCNEIPKRDFVIKINN